MKKILLYLFIPFLFACTDDAFEPSGTSNKSDLPEGKALISLDILSGNFHKPMTKGVNPDAVFSNPYILSFKLQSNGSATDTILHEVVKTNLDGGKYTAQLSKSTEPHLLVFIANADTLVRHRVINHFIISKKYGEVMPLFTYGDPTSSGSFGLYGLKNPTIAIPFVRERIPMWAKLNVDKIEPGSKITTPVYLQRIVSKIYIDASEANKKNNFTLNGFTVLGVPSHAYIDNDGAANSFSPQLTVNYGTAISEATEINGLILTNISNNTTASVTDDKPVFVFPFRKDDDRGGVYHIVLSGHFGDNVTKYFKVKIGGPDSPAALNKPNTAYQINIQSIANNGYVSLEQALQYEAGTGVVVKVRLLDNSHEIIANGQYYMGLSNSEFLLYANGEQNDVTVVTVNTNAFSPGATTIAPGKIELISGNNVTLTREQNISSNQTDVKVSFKDQMISEGVIRVTIGELSRDISVRKINEIYSNYEGGSEGLLLGNNVLSAYISDNISNVGLATSANSTDRLSKIETLSGSDVYLFIKNGFNDETLNIRMLNKEGKTTLIQKRTSVRPLKKIILKPSGGITILEDVNLDELYWESNTNNYLIEKIENTIGVRLHAPENTTPVDWMVYDYKMGIGAPSTESNIDAVPILEPCFSSIQILDKRGYIQPFLIYQDAPYYMGYYGGATGNGSNGYRYGKRLIMDLPDKVISMWSKDNTVTGITDYESGLSNTRALVGMGNSLAYPAAWHCWMKNDKNGDGIVSDVEIGQTPWYLPSQNQLLGIWISSNEIPLTDPANTILNHWSSTEKSSTSSVFINLFDGATENRNITSPSKSNAIYVRCVRDL